MLLHFVQMYADLPRFADQALLVHRQIYADSLYYADHVLFHFVKKYADSLYQLVLLALVSVYADLLYYDDQLFLFSVRWYAEVYHADLVKVALLGVRAGCLHYAVLVWLVLHCVAAELGQDADLVLFVRVRMYAETL